VPVALAGRWGAFDECEPKALGLAGAPDPM
jgi:hypothetical protein